MSDIYILKLENNKYYVGKSSDPIKRFQEHIKGKGSSWTREHKPLEIIKTIKNASVFDEDKYVKEYMSKYGINNVRGGSYVSTTLDENQKELLRSELRMAEDKCTRCGRDGHFASSCYAKTQLVEESESEEEYEYRKPVICYSCNKYGHYASSCYSRNQYIYESDSDEESESDYYSD
jgi:predicted GIY-YIG superfamily endonuclease